MTVTPALDHLEAQRLRELAIQLVAEMHLKQVLIDKLTHEVGTLKRLKFAVSEAYTAERQQLLFETIETDLEALSVEIERLASTAPAEREKRKPKRAALPASLPCRDFHHEPDSTTCSCGCQLKRIGEDVAEKLDYQPGVCTVQRNVHGKWVCRQC